MGRKEEVRGDRTRAQALYPCLSWLESGIRAIEHSPDLLFSTPLMTQRNAWGGGYAKEPFLQEQLLSKGSHRFILNAALGVAASVRFVLGREFSFDAERISRKRREPGRSFS